MNPEGNSSTVSTAPPLLNGRYELGDRLTEGTFFYTHRGRDTETGKAVAIKILKPEYSGDEAFSSRLKSEAESATGLDHPNIAKVYETWREQGTLIIVTEWVRGINLRDRIRRVAPFPVSVSTDILLACAEALNHAHGRGFVHGDLRPDNIIITPEGRVKVTDFGVGMSVAASTRIQLDALPQAVYYLAPEVSQGRMPDTRTDIYSLGCILYEMLAGEVPFDAETPLAVAVKHLNDPAPALQKANPAVPNAVNGVALKCMQKDPAGRYSTVENLLQDLHAIRDALHHDRPLTWSPIKEAVEAPVAEKTKPHSRRRERREEPEVADTGPSAGLLVGLALVALTMILVFFGIGMLITQAPKQVTVPPDLVGMPQAEATTLLRKIGLKEKIQPDFHDRVTAGKVFATDPRGGTDIRANKTVTLFVSQGPQPVTVPDVVGEELAAARKQLSGANLALGEAREEYSSVVDKGKVISQSPTSGSQVKKNSAVNLVISKGEEPLPDMPPVDIEPQTGDNPPSGENPNAGTPPAANLPERAFEVSVQVPRSASGAQTVRIVVRHEDGSEQTVYEQNHEPGDVVKQTVTVYGNPGKCQIQTFVDGRVADTKKV
jgi:eukaryotic-like serine/threonine-protein kinase